MVTAELAACLPVLMLILGVAVSAVSVVAAHARVQDAAREAVRAVARGDDAAARRLVAAAAPGAQLLFSRVGDDVTARVRLTVHPLGAMLPSIDVVERAVAAAEPVPTAASP